MWPFRRRFTTKITWEEMRAEAQKDLDNKHQHVKQVLPVGAHFTYEGVWLRVVGHLCGHLPSVYHSSRSVAVLCRYRTTSFKIEELALGYDDVMAALDDLSGNQVRLRGDYPSSTGTPPFSQWGC